MKRLKILVALLLAFSATACRHEAGDSVLELRAESFGGTKMSVADIYAEWSAGDSVWVNGNTSAVSFSGGKAQILVPHATNYNAVFPASIMTGNNRVTLPSTYHYATDANGKQLLDLPMIASSDGNGLYFYHLTGALIVKYVNRRSQTVTVDRVTVSSNEFALCGERTISFGDTAQAPSTVGDRSVTIYFDRQVTTLASGDTLAVMIPVAPVGDSNKFTVEVSSHVAGNRYTVSNTQSSANAFPRNALGYAYMSVENGSRATALFQETGDDGNKTMNIYTASEFKLMQTAINGGWTLDGFRYSTFSYSIEADIDMSGIEIAPIHGFTGTTFNGNNHTISNLTITSNSECCALFDTITRTSISLLSIRNVVLSSNGNNPTRYISPIIGRLSTTNTVTNCTVSVANINTSSANTIYYGGVAAVNGSSAAITNCEIATNCAMSSSNSIYFGGIIGQTDANVSCSTSRVLNKVELTSQGNIYVGGLFGNGKTKSHTVVTIICSDTINTLTGSGNIYAGGLVGYFNNNTSNLSGKNCTISGNINASTNGTNILYIGKIYGYGKLAGRYGIGNNYNASNLIIPTNGGLIISGDPTGTY